MVLFPGRGRGCGGRSWVGAGARLQVPVLCAASLHTARPRGSLWTKVPHAVLLHTPHWTEGRAAIFHEELWSEVPGVRPLHAAAWEQVNLD